MRPIVVRECPSEPGRYEVLAGQRRVHVCRRLPGRKTIPALVMHGVSDEAARLIRLTVEVYRNPHLRAEFYCLIAGWRDIHRESNRVGLAGGMARASKASGGARSSGRGIAGVVRRASASGGLPDSMSFGEKVAAVLETNR